MLDGSVQEGDVTLHIVPVEGGAASLGSWGTVVLSGAESALLRIAGADDVELPPAVAADITGGVLLLNEDTGCLLYLPYAGELIVSYDLRGTGEMGLHIRIDRDPDYGMRMAEVRVVPGLGAVHLTETTLMLFTEECAFAWRRDDDFSGWSIEGVTSNEVRLMAGDWAGREQRQNRSLVDGSVLQ